MKTILSILSLFILILLVTPSQAVNPDSLVNILNGAKTSEKKISVLFKLTQFWSGKNPDSCLLYADQLKNVALQTDDENSLVWGYYFVIISYYDMGKADIAMQISHEAMVHFQTVEDQTYRANLLVLVAEKNRAKAQYQAALSFLYEANNITIRSDDSMFHAQIYNRLAATYFELKNYQRTIACVDSSLTLVNNNNQLSGILINNYELLGAVAREKGQYTRAINYFQLALGKLDEDQNNPAMPNLLNNLAKTYLDLNNNKKALEYSLQSYRLAGKENLPEVQVLASENTSEAYARLGNFEQAYNYARIFSKIRSDLFKQDQNKEIAELNAKYESAKKKIAIQDLAHQNLVYRYLTITGIIITLLIVFIFIIVIVDVRKLKIIAEQRLTIEKQEHEKIKIKLDANKQELTGKVLSLVKTEDMINHLKDDIQKILPQTEGQTSEQLTAVLQLLKQNVRNQDLWKEFESRFNELNNGFIGEIIARYPTLSPVEIRLCALLRLQLSSKEIAELNNRSSRTIEYTRTNIRKKMGIGKDDNLTTHLLSI